MTSGYPVGELPVKFDYGGAFEHSRFMRVGNTSQGSASVDDPKIAYSAVIYQLHLGRSKAVSL